MMAKKPPQKPDKISQPYLINAVIGSRKRINLVISYYYKKRNVEYLNFEGKKVKLIDTDPLQTSQAWVDNCQKKGRNVSTPADYQFIDTAGSSGSYLG